MSCGCGKKKCNGKCGISPSVLQINNNECTLFHKVEIPAVMGDETTNPPKTGAYRNVLLYYEASGNSYLYSSDGIPTKLTGVVSDYEALTNKPSINGVVLIKNKTLADLGIISAIDSAVADEATARTNADNALSDRITTNANNIAANATAISNEVTARTNADNTLSARISGNTTAINNEKTARENADAGLQDQITAVKATADSAVQPDDIDKTVMSDLAVDSNSSTAQVILKESKVNLKTGATSSEQTSLPVASSSQAGVMNSATYDAVTSNTSNINAIMNGAVAITGLPANPSQSDLTTAWQNETGLSTLINRASVYDVTNNKVWTYYTNDTTWHVASNTSQVTVNTFTNSSEGTIKGSTSVGQVFAENDGTGSVNGWDALSDAVSNNTSKLAGIESGAEVNVQSDWNVSDSSSDAYIKNKPTIGNATLTIQKNGTTIDTFTANSTTNKTVNITVPTVNDATLTIQKNGDTVQTFTANSSSNKTANIEVPTKTSELDNDAGFIANDTHQVCGEGGNITLDTTTFEPLEMNHLGGNTSQQTYTGKNLFKLNGSTSEKGLTISRDVPTGSLTFGGTTTGTWPWLNNSDVSLPAGTYTFSIDHALPYSLTLRLYETSSSYPKSVSIPAGSTSGTSTTTYPIVYLAMLYGVTSTGVQVPTTTIYPMLESGSTATSFEPYVGGTASPNPDYPQAVQTVTGENVVKICGKNLLEVASGSATRNQSTITISNGNINYTASASGASFAAFGIDGSSIRSANYGDYVAWGGSKLGPGTYTLSIRYISGSTTTVAGSGGNFLDIFVYGREVGSTDRVSTQLAKASVNTTDQTATFTLTEEKEVNIVAYMYANSPSVNINFNVQLELGSATAYEPYQGQSYEVNLGKNLISSSWESGGYNNSTGAKVDGSGLIRTANSFAVEPNSTYIMSRNGSGVGMNVVQYMADGTCLGGSTVSSGNSFTTTAQTAKITLYRDLSGGSDGIQLEKGSTITSYAAYFEPIELCKIGTYQDYIYKSGEKWYVHKAINKVTVDGSAGGFNSNNNWYYYSLLSLPTPVNSGDIISNYFTGSTRTYMQNNKTVDGLAAISTNTDIIFRNTTYSSAADYKTWLAANTPTFYYQLATPTDTEITNEALIAQLENLWDADGAEGETNIFTVSDGVNERAILSVCQYPSHLPIATKTKLGTVVVGHGLDIEADGKLDVIVDDDFSTESDHPVQNKVITNALAGKADNTDLSTVAMTGSYDDLTGKPTIPTVNNATLTIQKNGTNVATFTANSSTNVTANITAPVVTMTTTDPGEGGALAANNFIGVYV